MSSIFLFLITVFFGLSFDRLNVFKYCILSSVLHELGHIVSYIIFTGQIPEIKISLFGFTMKNNVSYNKYLPVILLSGPMVNLILAVISYIYLQKQIKIDIYVFMLVNIIVFIMNILPVYYLDGGQVLYAKSALYQRFYRQISIISMFSISVMAYHFTDNIVGIIIFLLYFIINLANDI